MIATALKALRFLRTQIGELAVLGAAGFGALRPGLAATVLTIRRRHFRQNETLRSHRYSLVRRAVAGVARHPFFAVALGVAAYAVVSWVTWLAPLPGPPTPAGLKDYFRDFQAINAAVLGAQASFIGIVFPLVIAFVGLLNQGRASFATRLTIYFEETAAAFVGGSALILCIALVLQMPFTAQVPERVAAAATVLNILWFTANVVALAFFIFRTIDYVHPAKRAPITRSYVANVAWRQEMLSLVTTNRWGNVDRYGHLPSGDEVEPFAEKRHAHVSYSPFLDSDSPVVSRTLRPEQRLIDVRFGILSPAIHAWLAAVRADKTNSAHNLSFPAIPGEDYKGDTVLARSTAPIGWASRLAIRTALPFRTVRNDPSEISETARLLKEMIADLIALIEQRQADEFGNQLTAVIEFHVFLLRIAQSPEEDFNFAQMQDAWGRSVSHEWSSEYRDLQRRAIDRIVDEPEFFGRCAYLPSGIYQRCHDDVTPAALKPVMLIGHNLFHHMMVWAANTHKVEAGQSADASHAFELKLHGESYGNAWRGFVAGWERLLEAINRRDGDQETTWADLKRSSDNVVEHLRMTAEMVGRSAWSGDLRAVNWSVDLLLNWIGLAERSWEAQGHAWWALRPQALTLDALELDWPAVSSLPLTAVEDVEPTPRAVFGGVVKNAWHDHIVALASVCIHWSIEFGAGGAASQAARTLLNKERFDRGSSGHHTDAPFTVEDVLIAILRIVGAGWRFSKSYASVFEGLAERLDSLREAPWVSMRIYSSNGGLGFSALYAEHVLAMMACAPGNGVIHDSLRRMLIEGNDEGMRRREEYLRGLLTGIDGMDAAVHGPALDGLLPEGQTESFDARRAAVRQLAEQAVAELEAHRLRAIQTAPLDPSRLGEVAAAASQDAFGAATGAFPLHLFEQVHLTTDPLTTFTLRSGNQEKGAYTQPQMAQPVSNERSWWRDVMRDQVGNIVWRDVLNAMPFEAIQGQTPEAFWQAVKSAGDRIRATGGYPILVISSVVEPRWLNDWRWREQAGGVRKPDDLTLNRDPKHTGAGYEFSMNDIPVYRAATFHGEAYVVPRALFTRVRFHDYGHDTPVAVSFEDDPNDSWRGTLKVEYQRDVQLGDGTAFRIVFASKEGPDASL